MRNIIRQVCTCLTALFMFGHLAAQSTKSADTMYDKHKKHKVYVKQEVGVQANYFIRQFIKPANTDSVTNPYVLTYTLYLMPFNVGLRAGVGYNYTRSEIDVIDEARLTINRSLNWRLGIEKRFRLGKRFSAYAGADYVYTSGKTDFSTYNSFEVVTNKTVVSQSGGGPVAGLSFRISKYISLSTEASYYYMSGVSTTSTTHSINVISGTSFDQKLESFIWRSPNALYCSISF